MLYHIMFICVFRTEEKNFKQDMKALMEFGSRWEKVCHAFVLYMSWCAVYHASLHVMYCVLTSCCYAHVHHHVHHHVPVPVRVRVRVVVDVRVIHV